ncbi:MAG: membrane-bound O-acyltransferase family protein [Phycisphaeraceae bacterium]|nr:membrane-bound O-acyltransferase family protein [Phycisphaeraceae bacterium]
MAFNSIEFLIFLPTVYLLYRLLNLRLQNVMLLAASYLFYGWWDERFLFLIVLSTAIDFSSGIMIDEGKLTRRDRAKASAWTLLSAIAFLGINWQAPEWAAKFQNTVGWQYCGYVLGLVIAGNALYPLLAKLPKQRRRGVFLFISMAANLGLLGFFKYCNFFIDSAESVITSMGMHATDFRLDIVLPVGISFYTFQTMSYTIDIYRGHLKPTHRFLDFALFVSFFPQLVAGPIERATHLLPSILHERRIDWEQSMRGCFLILMGLFKKIGVADSVAIAVNSVYLTQGDVTQLDIIVATVLFAVQIYCDFSGYSDIARGCSKIMGIELMTNFKLPYVSRTPSEFWTRWHISLSSWLRDYLYIPLGGNRGNKFMVYRNLSLTMLLGGLWHGAAWNFVLWGAYQGAILCIYRLLGIGVRRAGQEEIGITIKQRILGMLNMIFFFGVTCYGWLLFRAVSFEQIVGFTGQLLTDWGSSSMHLTMRKPTLAGMLGVLVLIVYELTEYNLKDTCFYKRFPVPIRAGLYALMIFIIFMGTSNAPVQFIYFQF